MYIRFGTDGWRGVIADDFTFENVEQVAAGLGRYLTEEAPVRGPVVVGYDRRFLSSAFAERIAEVLTSHEIEVELSDAPLPTPALAFWVRHRRAPMGVMVTASHNPPQFNGIKIKSEAGCSAPPELTAAIERWVKRSSTQVRRRSVAEAERDGLLHWFNPRQPYGDHLLSLVDSDAIRRAKLRVFADAMHGSSAEYLVSILERAGVDVVPVRAEVNPDFGGVSPEPIEANLGALRERLGTGIAHIGIALDGDGDRIGAVGPGGDFINPHQIFSLLLRHLVENRGERGEVVRTVSTTQMIDRLCRHYKLRLHEVPIGFKHIAALMLERDILIGGEESGGIGVRGHLPERDGIFSGLLLLEMMATTGKGILELRDDLFRSVGEHHYGRTDLRFDGPVGGQAVGELSRQLPETVCGRRVREVNRRDGVKFLLEDDSWLMLRASGTEPVVRIYAEASSPGEVKQLLNEGEKLLQQMLAYTAPAKALA